MERVYPKNHAKDRGPTPAGGCTCAKQPITFPWEGHKKSKLFVYISLGQGICLLKLTFVCCCVEPLNTRLVFTVVLGRGTQEVSILTHSGLAIATHATMENGNPKERAKGPVRLKKRKKERVENPKRAPLVFLDPFDRSYCFLPT